MDNDGVHKFGYGHRDLVADLMRLVAPALAAELDFARAEELLAAYVQLASDRWTAPGAAGGLPEWSMKSQLALVAGAAAVERGFGTGSTPCCRPSPPGNTDPCRPPSAT